MGGRGVRDPVPDIREIIIDRKEAGGLPSSTFLNLAPEKQEKLQHALEILRRGMGAKTHPAQRS